MDYFDEISNLLMKHSEPDMDGNYVITSASFKPLAAELSNILNLKGRAANVLVDELLPAITASGLVGIGTFTSKKMKNLNDIVHEIESKQYESTF